MSLVLISACSAFVDPRLDLETGPCPIEATHRKDNGLAILFGSEYAPSLRVVARPDSTDLTTVAGSVEASKPSWSCDGKHVAFVGASGDRIGIHEVGGANKWIDLDTAEIGGERTLAYSPVFSPDGATIAFSVEVPEDDYNMYVFTVRTDGSSLTRVSTRAFLQRRSVGDPSWSADGRYIAWDQGRQSSSDVVVAKVDGSTERVDFGESARPTFSPVGDHLARVHQELGASQASVVVSRVDGSEQRVIYRGNVGSRLAWSPSGDALAFVKSGGDGGATGRDLLVVGMDGIIRSDHTNAVSRYSHPMEASPSWSPDGGAIAFVGGDYPLSNILIASVGSDEPPRPLFPEGGEYLAVSWAT